MSIHGLVGAWLMNETAKITPFIEDYTLITNLVQSQVLVH